MDPISALGLVANIFGVISFASGVVKIAAQIHESGANDQIDILEQSADALRSEITLIEQTSFSPDLTGSQSDQNLLALAKKGVEMGLKISNLVQDVRGNDNGKHPAWRTFRQTFKTVWNKGTIDILNTQLSDIREELQRYAVFSIKEKLESQSVRLEDVLKSLDEHVLSRLSSNAFFQSFDEIQGQTITIIDNQHRSEILAEARHKEVIKSIEEISGTPGLGAQQPSHRMSLSREQIDGINQAILLSLWFPDMMERMEAIHEAYDKTYQWVFDDSQTTKPWDSLPRFLQEDSRTYWITGKPGSGKSTLMKFILGNSKTRESLHKWSEGSGLVTAQHYFSYKGSDLQKSEVGVLRCLLYQILQQRTDLIKIAFPERFQAFCTQGQGKMFEPRPLELKEALTKTIKSQPSSHFFLAIDGFDEYDASATEMSLLVETFKHLSTYSNSKALLSSRPWVIFEESFKLCPRLRLHELTRPDIVRFTSERIARYPRSEALQSRNPTGVQSLVEEIVESSSGVFLWVSLVVRSLLEGLRNHDTFEDLQARLREFPSELEDLFLHMWNKIPQRYQAQASRLLQIIEVGTARGQKLSLLGLSFAEEDEGAVEITEVKPLEEQDVEDRLESMQVQLLTRCVGLVEVEKGLPTGYDDNDIRNDFYPNTIEKKQGYPHVTFLHKTVYEFLSSADIRKRLTDAATDPGGRPFCAEVSLLRSSLLRIKSFVAEEYPPFSRIYGGVVYYRLETLVCRCLILAKKAELATGRSQTKMLQQLDSTMTAFQNMSEGAGNVYWVSCLTHCHSIKVVDDKTAQVWGKIGMMQEFLSLAVFHGLVLFVAEYTLDKPGLIREMRDRPLLFDALFPFISYKPSDFTREIGTPLPSMVRHLLDNGANINETPNHLAYSPWTAFVGFVVETLRDRQFTPRTLEVLTILLEYGADLNRGNCGKSLLEVCRELLDGNSERRIPADQAHLMSARVLEVIGMLERARIDESGHQEEVEDKHRAQEGRRVRLELPLELEKDQMERVWHMRRYQLKEWFRQRKWMKWIKDND